MKKLLVLLASMIAAPLVAPVATLAAAQGTAVEPVTLKGEVKLEKKVIENSVETIRLVEPTTVVPGDRLLFRTTFQNNSATAVDSFVVTNPLPSAVAIVSPSSEELNVSVDGGKTWGRLAALKVADGQGGMRAAAATDVTHIQWTIPRIEPGASGALEYHAVVR